MRFLGLQFVEPYSQVVDLSDGVPWARWFTGGRLNLAASCVDRWADDDAGAELPAVVWEGEEGTTRTLSWRELRSLTDGIASGLAARGVK